MEPRRRTKEQCHTVSAIVSHRIEQGGERIWKFDDFGNLPFLAVAQALSRLARSGKIERLSKGVYYCGRKTALGKSRPNPTKLHKLARRGKTMFPAGTAAASLLGLTSQTSSRRELSTSASSLPRKLVGDDTVIHTRRPEAWSKLNDVDAAVLELLRQAGRTSEFSPTTTIERLLRILSEDNRFRRLHKIADTEPPRVRAMLGALGEKLGRPPKEIAKLRRSLNPSSRFNFGLFSALDNARDWQAKES